MYNTITIEVVFLVTCTNASDHDSFQMDCTSNQDICQNYEVKGYPTLMFFVEGAKVKH